MRTAPSRIRRLLALLLLALSVGWLLLRRRSAATPAPVLVPVPDLPPEEPAALATDAGVTEEPAAPAPEPVSEPADEVPSDVIATDAGLTDAPPADTGEEGVHVEAAPTAVIPAVRRELDPDATTILPRFVDPDEPAPTGTDDLRRIRGIGPAIERTLHELGITTYQQIVELEGPPLERLRERLEGFSARIEREDWRGQARDLHRLKYGEQR